MPSNIEIASSFVQGAPPGELNDVVAGTTSPYTRLFASYAHIKALTSHSPNLVSSLEPAFQAYNETQLATTKLPGGSQEVIVSEYNKLDNGRYFDPGSESSFEFDHVAQASVLAAPPRTASAPQSHPLESQNSELIKSILRALSPHVREHFSSSSYGVYPSADDSAITILLVANKYSPNNFWNGRYRAIYHVPVSSPATMTGKLHVDVHYYEDGNVSLSNTKPVSVPIQPNLSADTIVRRIAAVEREHQEELNGAFGRLAEGAFKGLRRQLPITRQKVEWDKVGGYRLGQDIAGGRA
ncbi:F-actin-capping protein subunit alpha [Ophidiomyces ophidiicola]|nr:F-actin-capping protein subunit alpha [Ophidiomyces ophidiicola]KAI1960756.1 F-actin-capping protein subunit alpha [Ophidiomyces ophidiicola]